MLGVLFSIGTCSYLTLRSIETKVMRGWAVADARQVITVLLISKSDNSGSWPESMEKAIVENFGGDPATAERLLTLRPAPHAAPQKWIYFRPSSKSLEKPVVVIVSPRFEGEDRWLNGNRVVGFSDNTIAIMGNSERVLLPEGRTAVLSDIR